MMFLTLLMQGAVAADAPVIDQSSLESIEELVQSVEPLTLQANQTLTETEGVLQFLDSNGEVVIVDFRSALQDTAEQRQPVVLRLQPPGDDQKTNNPYQRSGVSAKTQTRADCILNPKKCANGDDGAAAETTAADLVKEVAELRALVEKICSKQQDLCQ